MLTFRSVTGHAVAIDTVSYPKVADAKGRLAELDSSVNPSTVQLVFRSRILGDEDYFWNLKIHEGELIMYQTRSMIWRAFPKIPTDLPTPTSGHSLELQELIENVAILTSRGYSQADANFALRTAGMSVDLAEQLLTQGLKYDPQDPIEILRRELIQSPEDATNIISAALKKPGTDTRIASFGELRPQSFLRCLGLNPWRFNCREDQVISVPASQQPPPQQQPQPQQPQPQQQPAARQVSVDLSPDCLNSIEQLASMGFDRKLSEGALVTCNWDISEATEVLISANPDQTRTCNIHQELRQQFRDNPGAFIEQYRHVLETFSGGVSEDAKRDPVQFLRRLGLNPDFFDINAARAVLAEWQQQHPNQMTRDQAQAAIARLAAMVQGRLPIEVVIEVFVGCGSNEQAAEQQLRQLLE